MGSPGLTYSTFPAGTTADGVQVSQDFTDLLNAITDGTKTLTISSLVAGTATLTNTTANVNGLIIQGDANTSGSPANSQFIIRGNTSAVKRLTLAYNTSSNYGELSSESSSGVYTPIVLAPNGGSVGVGGAPTATNQLSTYNFATLTGTGAIAGSTALTGTGTKFLSELKVGWSITVAGETKEVSTITSDIAATVTVAFSGTSSGNAITTPALETFMTYPNGSWQVGGTRTNVTNTNVTWPQIVGTSPTSRNEPTFTVTSYAGTNTVLNSTPAIRFYRAAGTEASPTAIGSGDVIGILQWRGFGSSFGPGPQIQGTATEAWVSTTSRGSSMTFFTVPNTTNTQTAALTLGQDTSATFGGTIKNGVSGNEFTGNNQTVVMGGADGPAGVTLSKISGPTKWLKILDSGGSAAYIPLYQ